MTRTLTRGPSGFCVISTFCVKRQSVLMSVRWRQEKGNESIVQKEKLFYRGNKRSWIEISSWEIIGNGTYNPVGFNKVSHFSGRGRALSRLPMKKLTSLLKKTWKVRHFVLRGILKNTPLSSKSHCWVKNRYRRNCKSVRFLLRASPKLVRKQGQDYLSSKHKRRGTLVAVRF